MTRPGGTPISRTPAQPSLRPLRTPRRQLAWCMFSAVCPLGLFLSFLERRLSLSVWPSVCGFRAHVSVFHPLPSLSTGTRHSSGRQVATVPIKSAPSSSSHVLSTHREALDCQPGFSAGTEHLFPASPSLRNSALYECRPLGLGSRARGIGQARGIRGGGDQSTVQRREGQVCVLCGLL